MIKEMEVKQVVKQVDRDLEVAKVVKDVVDKEVVKEASGVPKGKSWRMSRFSKLLKMSRTSDRRLSRTLQRKLPMRLSGTKSRIRWSRKSLGSLRGRAGGCQGHRNH